MKRFKNILFVADREDGLDAALERAVAVSRTNSARLTVMDVTPDAGLDRLSQADLCRRSQRPLERTAARIPGGAHPAVYGCRRSRLHHGGHRYAVPRGIRAVQRNAHDLVMKVAQHATGLTPALFGSDDMHLLRKCPCPVWIDRPAGARHYQRLLAAVDPFDDESGDLQRLILDLATSLAERERAALDIVHAWELPGESMLANGRGRIARNELDLLLDDTEKRHRQALDALLSALWPEQRGGQCSSAQGAACQHDFRIHQRAGDRSGGDGHLAESVYRACS